MWERRVENGAGELCPLLSFFLMLPLFKPVSQALGSVGWIRARIEERWDSLWEMTGALVTWSWCLPVDACWLQGTGVGWGGRGKFFRAGDGPHASYLWV